MGQVATATGLGGIGKTQLASELVHRYGRFFAGGVFWLSFADPEAVPAGIAGCGRPGNTAGRPCDDPLKLGRVRFWCAERTLRLRRHSEARELRFPQLSGQLNAHTTFSRHHGIERRTVQRHGAHSHCSRSRAQSSQP